MESEAVAEVLAKRMECVRLAGAVVRDVASESGSKLPHSKRSARGRDDFRSAEFIPHRRLMDRGSKFFYSFLQFEKRSGLKPALHFSYHFRVLRGQPRAEELVLAWGEGN